MVPRWVVCRAIWTANRDRYGQLTGGGAWKPAATIAVQTHLRVCHAWILRVAFAHGGLAHLNADQFLNTVVLPRRKRRRPA